MKKLLVVLAIGAFAACNNSSSTEAKADSTTAKPVDSPKMAAPADSTKKDSSAVAKPDSAAKKADSVKK